MDEFLSTLQSVFTTAFAVASMFSMGLGLTIAQIVEPLRNLRLVAMALIASFVIMPVTALVLSNVMGLQLDHRIGLLLIASVAGAPMTVKLAQIARGNVVFAVSLVVLLVVGTVIYLPLVLPLLLPGVEVDAGVLATPLVVQILLPLVIGLALNVRYDEEAEYLRGIASQIANTSLALLLALMLLLNLGNVLGLFGSGTIIAMAIFFVIAAAAGYLLGGPDVADRRVLSLATAQRNFAAAFVIGSGNFVDRPEVMVVLAAAGVVAMIILFPLAGEFGRRSQAEEEAEAGAVGAAVPVTGKKGSDRRGSSDATKIRRTR